MWPQIGKHDSKLELNTTGNPRTMTEVDCSVEQPTLTLTPLGCRGTCTLRTSTTPMYLAEAGVNDDHLGRTSRCLCWGPFASDVPATGSRVMTSISPVELALGVVEVWLLAL